LADLASRENGTENIPSSVMSKLSGQNGAGAEEEAKKAAENEEYASSLLEPACIPLTLMSPEAETKNLDHVQNAKSSSKSNNR
jgi:hypothetical protein